MTIYTYKYNGFNGFNIRFFDDKGENIVIKIENLPYELMERIAIDNVNLLNVKEFSRDLPVITWGTK